MILKQFVMNLPTEKLYSLGRDKMFKCWKWSSSDPMLVYYYYSFILELNERLNGCI